MNDQLRHQLRQLDPMHPGVATESPATPPARARMERVMSTITTDRPVQQQRRRKTWIVFATSLAVVGVGVLGALSLGGGSGAVTQPLASPTLELSLGMDDGMAICLPFDVATLATQPVAFEGTATAVEGERITLAVDHWYTGGDSTHVELVGQTDAQALIGGVPFAVGGSYLVTATDGAVNFCGYSGEATPELRAFFDQALGR